MPKGFGKNFVKSFGGALKDYFLDEALPNAKEATESSNEWLKENVFNKSSSSSIKGKANDYWNMGKGAAKDFVKNALEDIKSGHWFGNSERAEKEMAKSMGMDFGDDDWGGLDEGFDSDSFGDPNSDFSSKELESSGDIYQYSNDNRKMTIDDREFNSNVIRISNTKVGTDGKQLFAISKGMTDRIVGSLDHISEQVEQLAQFNIDVTQNFYDKTLEYYDRNLNALTAIQESIEGLNPKKSDKEYQNVYDKIFGFSGVIDLKKYIEEVINNSPFGMASGMVDGDTLSMLKSSIVSDPMKLISKKAIEFVMPEDFKKSMENLNQSIKDIPRFVIGQMGYLKRKGKGNFITDLLGIDFDSKKEAMKMSSNYNKGPMAYNGKANKAITEIIPTLLSKIYSAVSGRGELAVDYDKYGGTLTDKSKLDRESLDQLKRSTLSEGSATVDAVKATLYKNNGLSEKEINELRKQAIKGDVSAQNKLNTINAKKKGLDQAAENTLFTLSQVKNLGLNNGKLDVSGFSKDDLALLNRLGTSKEDFYNIANMLSEMTKNNTSHMSNLYGMQQGFANSMKNSSDYTKKLYNEGMTNGWGSSQITGNGPTTARVIQATGGASQIYTQDMLYNPNDDKNDENNKFLNSDKLDTWNSSGKSFKDDFIEKWNEKDIVGKMKLVLSTPFRLIYRGAKHLSTKLSELLFNNKDGIIKNITSKIKDVFMNFLTGKAKDEKSIEESLGYRIRAFFSKDSAERYKREQTKKLEEKQWKTMEENKIVPIEGQENIINLNDTLENLDDSQRASLDILGTTHDFVQKILELGQESHCFHVSDVRAAEMLDSLNVTITSLYSTLTGNKVDLLRNTGDSDKPYETTLSKGEDSRFDIFNAFNNAEDNSVMETNAPLDTTDEAKLNNPREGIFDKLKRKLNAITNKFRNFLIGSDKDKIDENSSIPAVLLRKFDLHILAPFKDLIIGKDGDKIDKDKNIFSVLLARLNLSVIEPLKDKIKDIIIGKDDISKEQGIFGIIKEKFDRSIAPSIKNAIIGKDADKIKGEENTIFGVIKEKINLHVFEPIKNTIISPLKNKLLGDDKDNEKYNKKGLFGLLGTRMLEAFKGKLGYDRDTSMFDIIKDKLSNNVLTQFKNLLIGNNEEMQKMGSKSSLLSLLKKRFELSIIDPMKAVIIGSGEEEDGFDLKKGLFHNLWARAKTSLFNPILAAIRGDGKEKDDRPFLQRLKEDVFDKIKDFLAEAFKPITETFSFLKDRLKTFFKEALSPILDEVKYIALSAIKILTSAATKIVVGITKKVFGRGGLFGRILGFVGRRFLNIEHLLIGNGKGKHHGLIGGLLGGIIKTATNIGKGFREKQRDRLLKGKADAEMFRGAYDSLNENERKEYARNRISKLKGRGTKSMYLLDTMDDTERENMFNSLKNSNKWSNEELEDYKRKYTEHINRKNRKTDEAAKKGDPGAIYQKNEEFHDKVLKAFSDISNVINNGIDKLLANIIKKPTTEATTENDQFSIFNSMNDVVDDSNMVTGPEPSDSGFSDEPVSPIKKVGFFKKTKDKIKNFFKNKKLGKSAKEQQAEKEQQAIKDADDKIQIRQAEAAETTAGNTDPKNKKGIFAKLLTFLTPAFLWVKNKFNAVKKFILGKVVKSFKLFGTKILAAIGKTKIGNALGTKLSSKGGLLGKIGSKLLGGSNVAAEGADALGNGATTALGGAGATGAASSGGIKANSGALRAAAGVGGAVAFIGTTVSDYKAAKESGAKGKDLIAQTLMGQTGKTMGDKLKNAGKQALKWGGLGMAIGSIFPGIGTLIGGGIGAVIGFIGGFIGQDPKGAMDVVKNAFSNIGQKLKSFFEEFPAALKDGINNIMEGLFGDGTPGNKGIIGTLSDELPNILSSIGDGLVNAIVGLVDTIPGVISSITDALPNLLEGVVDGIVNFVYTIADQLPNILDHLVDAAMNVVTGLVKSLPQILKGIIGAIPKLLGGVIAGAAKLVVNLVAKLPEILFNVVKSLVGALWDLIKDIPNILKSIFIDAPLDILESFFGEGSMQPIRDFFDEIFGFLDPLFKGVEDFFSGIMETVGPIFDEIGNFFNTGINMLKPVFEEVGKVFNGIIDFLKPILGTLFEFFGKYVGGIFNAIKDVVGGFINGVKKYVGGVFEFFGGLFDGIGKFFGSIFKLFQGDFSGAWEDFSGAFKSIWDGICGFFGGLFGGIGDFFGGIINGVKDFVYGIPVIGDFFKGLFGDGEEIQEDISDEDKAKIQNKYDNATDEAITTNARLNTPQESAENSEALSEIAEMGKDDNCFHVNDPKGTAERNAILETLIDIHDYFLHKTSKVKVVEGGEDGRTSLELDEADSSEKTNTSTISGESSGNLINNAITNVPLIGGLLNNIAGDGGFLENIPVVGKLFKMNKNAFSGAIEGAATGNPLNAIKGFFGGAVDSIIDDIVHDPFKQDLLLNNPFIPQPIKDALRQVIAKKQEEEYEALQSENSAKLSSTLDEIEGTTEGEGEVAISDSPLSKNDIASSERLSILQVVSKIYDYMSGVKSKIIRESDGTVRMEIPEVTENNDPARQKEESRNKSFFETIGDVVSNVTTGVSSVAESVNTGIGEFFSNLFSLNKDSNTVNNGMPSSAYNAMKEAQANNENLEDTSNSIITSGIFTGFNFNSIDENYNNKSSKLDIIINSFIHRFFKYWTYLRKNDYDYKEGVTEVVKHTLGISQDSNEKTGLIGVLSDAAEGNGEISKFLKALKPVSTSSYSSSGSSSGSSGSPSGMPTSAYSAMQAANAASGSSNASTGKTYEVWQKANGEQVKVLKSLKETSAQAYNAMTSGATYIEDYIEEPPIDTKVITPNTNGQHNTALSGGNKNAPFDLPIDPKDFSLVTTGFGKNWGGKDTNTSYGINHKGIDITSVIRNPELYAVADGVVDNVNNYPYNVPAETGQLFTGSNNDLGNEVTFKTSDGYRIKYMHMAEAPMFKVGDKIKKGQLIGHMGNTGASTGQHLHFEINDSSGKPVNPEVMLSPYSASRNAITSEGTSAQGGTATRTPYQLPKSSGGDTSKGAGDFNQQYNIKIPEGKDYNEQLKAIIQLLSQMLNVNQETADNINNISITNNNDELTNKTNINKLNNNTPISDFMNGLTSAAIKTARGEF